MVEVVQTSDAAQAGVEDGTGRFVGRLVAPDADSVGQAVVPLPQCRSPWSL